MYKRCSKSLTCLHLNKLMFQVSFRPIPGEPLLKCMDIAGFEPGRAIAPIPHCNWNCPFKKTAKGTICPLQTLGKKLERKNTRRDLFRYRSCKLKQNVESIFYRTFKVHSKVTFQSRSTAIFVGNLRQGF